MGSRSLAAPLVVAVVLSGVLFRTSLSGGSGQSAATPQSATKSALPKAAGSPGASGAPEGDEPSDVIDVLADSYGIDTSSDALQRRASWSARTVGDKTRPDAVQKEVHAFLQDVSRLSRQANLPSPEAAGQAVADLSDRDETALKIRLLDRQLALHDSNVRYLIATLPDPIDSYTGWQFDPMLDGIVQGISASNYILDRYYLPDAPGAGQSEAHGARSRHLHDEEPGLVVFRKQVGTSDYDVSPCFRTKRKETGADQPSWQDRLVLLVVHENPAAGVHPRALVRAINWVDRWPASPPCESILILGPTFSGTSDSMSRALELARARGVTRSIRIVSGSATDPENKATLERTRNVVFHATVHPDSVLTKALFEQFAALHWSSPLGLLHEANTQYGRQLAMQAEKVEGLQVVRLPFPMNLSRLRTTTEQKAGKDDTLGLPMAMRPLPMEEQENPEDKIPEYFPNTTSAYIALGLRRMLETLRQDNVKSVALMATDPRDKLYLAQQIALFRPDVSILTAESDSVYLHPDYSSYMQGALVASTYPLYGALQHWTYGASRGARGPGEHATQREFANDSAQGIYNAAVALLDYDQPAGDDERYAPAVPNIEHPPALVEYGTPGAPCSEACGPPMWLSVVGRSSTLPLRAAPYTRVPQAVSGTGPYIFEVQEPAWLRSTSPPTAFAPFPSPTLDAVFLVTSLAILWYCWFARRARRAPDGAFAPASHSEQLRALFNAAQARGRGAFLAAIAAALAIESFAAVICFARVRIDQLTRGSFAAFVLATASMFALLAIGFPIAGKFVVNELARFRAEHRRARWWAQPALWAAVALGSIAGSAVVALLAYEIQLVRDSLQPSFALGLIARAADPASGVCPTLPVVMLAVTVVFWGALELVRLRSPQVAMAQPGTARLVAPVIHGSAHELTSQWHLFERSILTVPRKLGAVAAIAAAAVCILSFDPWFRPLTTIEGPVFGHYVAAMVILLEIMVSLALLQFVWLWNSLRRLLERMAWHPIAGAFDRVPRELFPRDLLVRVPKLMELQRVVAFWDARLSTPQTRLTAQFEKDMRNPKILTWLEARSWQELLAYASVSVPVSAGRPQLAMAGRVGSATVAVPAAPPSTPSTKAPVAPEADAPTPHGELVAMSITLVIRDALARLGYNLVFVVAAVLLVFGSHVVFPFRQQQSLAALDWVFIGFTFTAIIVVLVQMKRNDIIGRLTAKASGERTTWDAAFVLKLAVFWLLPLLTLFAAQFPEIGGTLLHWLEPVEKALP